MWREGEAGGGRGKIFIIPFVCARVCVALNVQIFRADMAGKWISGIEKSIANHRIRKRVRARTSQTHRYSARGEREGREREGGVWRGREVDTQAELGHMDGCGYEICLTGSECVPECVCVSVSVRCRRHRS